MQNPLFFFSKKTNLTELTRHLGRNFQVWPIHDRFYQYLVSGLGLGVATFEMDTTRSIRIGIGQVFEPCSDILTQPIEKKP